MSSENRPMITNESINLIKSPNLLKKTAFDWDLFDNRAQVLKDLREKREFVDLMLTTEDGGEEVTHFAIVSSLGQQFTDYIDHQINSSDADEVILDNGFIVKKVLVKGVDKSVLKIIVDCSYNGLIETNGTTIWPLIETAESFQLKEVLDSSLTYLIRELNLENCVQIFHLGLKYEHKLSNASYSFIRTNFSKILNKCLDFGDLSLNELKELIVDDELNVKTEKTVFYAIIRWINCDINSRKDNISELLSKLRFGRIGFSFIVKNIANNCLISENLFCKQMVNNFKIQYNSLTKYRDGNGLYVGLTPESVRPRIPHELLIEFGGWQEGITSTTMESYDIRTNKWFDTKLSHDCPRAYHGMETIDGMVYVIGGTNGTEILQSVQCFNTIAFKWFERNPLIEKRCYVSTAVIDGIIYAMGGHNGRQRIKTCEKYHPISNQWTRFQDMNMIRSDGSATVYQRKIYIAGGLNDQMIENTVEFYDPNDKTWTFIQPMSTPRTSLGFECFNQSLYAIGGNNGFERLQSVERYDFKLKSWLPVIDMKSKRSTFATAIIEDNLFVVGGYNGQTPICLVEKYSSQENVWTEVRSLRHDRSGLAVCVLKGLSNTIDYTFIGQNNKKSKFNCF